MGRININSIFLLSWKFMGQ